MIAQSFFSNSSPFKRFQRETESSDWDLSLTPPNPKLQSKPIHQAKQRPDSAFNIYRAPYPRPGFITMSYNKRCLASCLCYQASTEMAIPFGDIPYVLIEFAPSI
ncbi:hypothetical protein TNCV_1621531 [Trichonephila clavipes]|nr:hypothetical protein TNCV_1621531 [Trichonephila clavipes]